MNWRRFFRRAQRDADSARDIQFYLDTETEDNLARGMRTEGARAAALRKFGNPVLIREEVHRMNSLEHVENTWEELLYELRTMRSKPAFVITAVPAIAQAIGRNQATLTL